MQANELLIKVLGEIIKEYREKSGKSIYKIAAESSMSKSTWREVEICACKNMDFTTFWKISEGLEIPQETLIKTLKERLGKDFTLID